MTRKERVYNVLKELCTKITLDEIKNGFAGFDASEVGEKADIDRSNASKELNALFSEKRVIKTKGRPVYFFDREIFEKLVSKKLDDDKLEIDSMDLLIDDKNEAFNLKKAEKKSFQKLVGAEGSLNLAIKQAKAAVLYPPRGLHTLLIGSTGVGKTTFAEMMYNFAVETKAIKPDSKFVIFNCSEYANNPQLIISQLFGHVKGAYTGAEKDKEGLIEKCNGGVLLLDEIHRLPPEGQEMLFLLMDKNIYRRLGETENTRKANVLLIGATTENVNSSLLQTFLRRIPMIIKLPDLSERPLSERLDFIKRFFNDEAKCVNVPIRVHKDVIKAFLLYDCRGNVGQLKGDIQLTCARGFLDYKTFGKDYIEIDIDLLHEYIYKGLLKQESNKEEIINLITIGNSKYYEFLPFKSDQITKINEYDISSDIYKVIKEKYVDYTQRGFSQCEINQMLNEVIEEYIEKLMIKFDVSKETPENEELFKVVSPRIYYAVKMALDMVEQKMNRKFNKKVVIGLCMHISALIERSYEGKSIDYKQMNNIELSNPIEYGIAKFIRKKLEEELEIIIPEEEIEIIAMLLSLDNVEQKDNSGTIGVIVIAHGRSTATSIAEVVNRLLGTDHCKAVDMPLEQKVDVALQKVIDLVKSVDQGKGVLLMVDMGSLIAFSEMVTKKTGIITKTIEMVSTPIVLEAVRKAMLPEMSLERLYKDIQRVTPYIGRFLIQDISNRVFIDEPRTIITTCLTGQGSAMKLVEFLKNALPLINDYNINLLPLNYDKYTNIDLKDIENIIAVVGTVDLNIPGVPYIPIDEVIIGDGLNTIEKIITGEKISYQNRFDEQNRIIKILEDTLTVLNPVKAYNIINDTYFKLINMLKKKNTENLQIKFLFHTCSMIERLILGESLNYNGIDSLISIKPELYRIIKNCFKDIEEIFFIEIPDTEIGYIMDLLDTQ